MNDENRIERVTAAELRTLTTIASSPTIATHDIETIRPVLGRAFSELVFLRAENSVLLQTARQVQEIRADLAKRIGLRLDDFTDKPRRRGANSQSIKFGVASELLRRRGLPRESIAVVLGGYSKCGVDGLLGMVAKRMRASAAFAAYVERVCK